jgi:predicted PurR-regulated permease PerM
MARDWSPPARITFGVLLAASLVLLGAIIRPLGGALFLGAAIAGVLMPWQDRLSARFGGRRSGAATLLTVGVVLLLFLPLTVFVSIAVREMIDGIGFVRQLLRSGNFEPILRKVPIALQPWLEELFASIPTELDDLGKVLVDSGQWAASALSGAVSATGRALLYLILTLIAQFVLLVDGHRLVAWIKSISPLPAQQTTLLLTQFRTVSASVLGSTVMTALVQATAATVGYLVAQIPHPMFFGLLTLFTALIPTVGTAVVAIPLTLFLFLSGHTYSGLFLLVWAVAVVGTVDNLIRPLFMKGNVRLSGAVIFFSLLGGVLAFGPIGLLGGPLAVTFFLSMIRIGTRE